MGAGAALAWGFVSSPIGRALGVGLIAALALGYAYMKGEEAAASRCDAASLRARVETLERDLDISRRAELRAREQQSIAAAREAVLNERLQTYENGLGETPPACLLSPDDVGRLRELTR